MKLQIATIIVTILCIITFGLGYKTYSLTHKTNTKSDNTVVTGNVQTKVVTVVRYVQKPVSENTDIKMTIPKPDLVVEVNGKKTTFNVAENENYLFDKNRLELEQSSKVSFSVNVKPIDLTKRWGIGVGYINGLNGIISGPIVGPFDFIGIANDKQIGAGALIRF